MSEYFAIVRLVDGKMVPTIIMPADDWTPHGEDRLVAEGIVPTYVQTWRCDGDELEAYRVATHPDTEYWDIYRPPDYNNPYPTYAQICEKHNEPVHSNC